MRARKSHLVYSAPQASLPAPMLSGPQGSASQRSPREPTSAIDGSLKRDATTMHALPQKKSRKKSKVSEVKVKSSQESERTFKSPRLSAGVRSESGEVGTDVSHLLLLVGLPADLSEYQLQQHFARSAPLQICLLHDWSSGLPRRAACLALSSRKAVASALLPEMSVVAGSCIRVLGMADAHHVEYGFIGSASSSMRQQVEMMEAKIRSASPAAICPASLSSTALRHLLLVCEKAAAHTACEEFVQVVRSGAPKNPGQLLASTLLRHRRIAGGQPWLGRVSGLPLPHQEVCRSSTRTLSSPGLT